VKIENGIPKIVDQDTWEKANDIYDTRQHKAGGQSKAKETYLLSGLISCGLCGGAMCGNKVKCGRGKSLRITYKCSTRKEKKECNAKEIRRDLVQQLVIDEVDRLLSDESIDDIIEYFYQRLRDMSKELPDEIKELKSRLKEIEKKVTSMVDAIMDGVYSPTMNEKLSAAEFEIEDLTNRISFYDHCNQISNAPDKDFITGIIAKDRGIKNKSPEEQRRIIRTYIKKVIVWS
ncbi:MAG: site-specific recombinase, invertase Pin, partial [Firmicutes bacterium]|nr:site-specific recombinase, invertase Pin [Bacillota bacterium]